MADSVALHTGKLLFGSHSSKSLQSVSSDQLFNSQCPEKAICYPFFIIILTFLLNSKRHPNIFLADQGEEFKTELNLKYKLEIS